MNFKFHWVWISLFFSLQARAVEKPELDPTCNDRFFAVFEAKQECEMNGTVPACMKLGILTSLGVGGATALAAKGFASILNKRPPAFQKKMQLAMTEIQKGGPDLNERLSKIFPDEARKLKPQHEAIAKAREEEGQAAQADDEQRYQKAKTERYEAEQKLSAQTAKSPNLELVNTMLEEGAAISQNPKAQAQLQTKVTEQVAESRVMKARATSAVSSGLAVVATAAAEGINLLMGQADIRTCRKDFGFSEAEIEFLGNGHLFVAAKAKKSQGWGCEHLTLFEPEKAYPQMLKTFGGVPKGICQLVRQQDAKLDEWLGKSGSNYDGSCHRITDANLKVYPNPDSNNDIFEYKTETHTYKVPFTKQINYPNFRFIEAYKDGKVDRVQSLKIQDFYNRLHPVSLPNPRPDLKDYSMGCDSNSQNDKVFCNLIKAAMRARVSRAIAKGLCEFKEPGEEVSKKTSVESSGKPGQAKPVFVPR